MKKENLGVKGVSREVIGVKADTLCLHYPRHLALTPLTPTNSSNSKRYKLINSKTQT